MVVFELAPSFRVIGMHLGLAPLGSRGVAKHRPRVQVVSVLWSGLVFHCFP